MSLSTKKRLLAEKMQNEILDLHPLLNDVLRMLPHITNVDYTHGPNEKGADFLLAKRDETLGDTYHIGVIAKLGKIQQNLSEIERQIEECAMERVTNNGKKKIVISEIWIIATDNITTNAKEKIHHKYSTSKINFVDGAKLIEWISDYADYFWHDIPTEVGMYMSEVRKQLDELDISTSIITKNNKPFYIELDIAKQEEGSYKRKNREIIVNLEAELSKNKVVMVEGEMGYGKSRLSRQIVKRYAAPEVFNTEKIVPIYVSFSSFVQEFTGDIEEYLKEKLGEELIGRDYKYLLALDGIDELGEESEGIAKEVREIVDIANERENILVLLTTRPLRNIDSEASLRKKIETYYIKSLTTKKIKEFFEQVCLELNISKRLLEDLKHSHLFKQLPQSPIAALLLSNLLAENAKELPSNLTELYKKSMELMLGRWDVDKGLYTQKEYEACDRICGIYAKYMLDNKLPQLSCAEAKQMLKKYLNERNLNIDPERLFEKLVNRSGVLSIDSHSKTVYFRHRSFSEFMYASECYRMDGISIDRRIFDLYWLNTYFFYIGLKKDCPDLLSEILAFPVSNEAEQWLKLVNMPNYFMAAYSTPYQLVVENLHSLFQDISSLYNNVIEGKTETNLDKLSEMKVLWLMQYLVRQSYSYEFFKKSMETTAVALEESIADEKVKIYALFFLSLVGLDLDEEGPLSYLVNEYGADRLPLPVSIALNVEEESNKKFGRSALLKKHNKKLKKLFRGNKPLQNSVKSLIDMPIRSRMNIE